MKQYLKEIGLMQMNRLIAICVLLIAHTPLTHGATSDASIDSIISKIRADVSRLQDGDRKSSLAVEQYNLSINAKGELCNISAYFKPIPTDVYGSELKEAFNIFEQALTARYGHKTDFKLINAAGMTAAKADDFMPALMMGRRQHSVVWHNRSGLSQNQDTVLILDAYALTNRLGQISFSYGSTKPSSCSDVFKSALN